MIRKLFFVLLLVVGAAVPLFACDICGCGGGNFYMGLLPDFKNKFIGIRYHYMQYHTQLLSDPSQFSHNYYNSVEVWTGWNLGKKWQLLAFVPYHFNKQVDDDGVSYKNGLGDISVMANYQLLRTGNSNSRSRGIGQELWVGAGIKLPTGTFNVDTRDPDLTVADINAQIGTGSVDFLLNAIYHVRFNQFGINTVASYKIGTTNHSDYKYGNKFTGTSIAYYQIRLGSTSIAPNVGLVYEHTAANDLNKQPVDLTGGYALSVLAGIEFTVNRVAVGFNVQGPLTQQYAAGQTNLQVRGMAHVTLVF